MALPPTQTTAENGTWREVTGEWRRLFGDFGREGVSVEFHRFRSEEELDWGRSFHPDSLEICLNFEGAGRLRTADAGESLVGVRSVAIYGSGLGSRSGDAAATLRATRARHERHRFVTLEMSRTYVVERLEEASEALLPPVRSYLRASLAGEPGGAPFALVQPMTVAVQNGARALVEPPMPAAAAAGRRVWYGAKVLELISLLLFAVPLAGGAGEELFCQRHRRLARERAERICALLERDLENPPTLEMLATEVGGSVFHLSRGFSAHVGMTIPQYLRQARLERAATLLRAGRHNVTEAALAVGYQSLSHFSAAFRDRFGCCPGLYANPRLAAAQARTIRRQGTAP